MDKITVDELKVFLHTGLNINPIFERDRDCKLTGIVGVGSANKLFRIRYHAVTENGLFGDSVKCISVERGADIGSIVPIVRPWFHIAREIEVDGEKFVPFEKFIPNREQYYSVRMEATDSYFEAYIVAEKIDGSTEKIKVTALPCWNTLKMSMKLASWHFDIFDWLDKTGEDGKPLALEME